MTPEMLSKFNQLRKKSTFPPSIDTVSKPPLTYKEYYNKRFLEECKYFIENPKFSMKYMMVMSHLQQNMKTKTLKEYKEKYPGAPINNIYEIDSKDTQIHTSGRAPYSRSIIQPLKKMSDINEEIESNCDNVSVVSDYDIIDDEPPKSLRRSQRIKTKQQ
tara:strand:+ start:758 stop:1237 length:480 start_codon:yes stop_codon:yes gene_type:complete